MTIWEKGRTKIDVIDSLFWLRIWVERVGGKMGDETRQKNMGVWLEMSI